MPVLDLLKDYWVVVCINSRNQVGVSYKYCVLIIKDYDWSQMKRAHSFDWFSKPWNLSTIIKREKNTGLNEWKKAYFVKILVKIFKSINITVDSQKSCWAKTLLNMNSYTGVCTVI